MTARTATASRVSVRGCALIVALGIVTFPGETTRASAFRVATMLDLERGQKAVDLLKPYYKILNLGTFNASSLCSPAECESHASDVNNLGQVTGWSRLGPHDVNDPGLRAFRTAPNAPIDASSPILLLTCTPPYCGSYFSSSGRSSFGNAINDYGWVVGTECVYGHANLVCDSPHFAFVAPSAQSLSLHVFPTDRYPDPFWDVSSAKAISNFFKIVGVGPDGSWIGNSASLLPSSIASPEDINDHGVVVGQSTWGRAFRWLTGSSVVEFLGALDLSCLTCKSIAYAINDAGVIVGTSEFEAALPGRHHAFILSPRSMAPSMTDLGTLCAYDPASATAKPWISTITTTL